MEGLNIVEMKKCAINKRYEVTFSSLKSKVKIWNQRDLINVEPTERKKEIGVWAYTPLSMVKEKTKY